MTRTLLVTSVILLVTVLYVQLAGVARQPMAGISQTPATTASADAMALDPVSAATEDLAAWPVAAGR